MARHRLGEGQDWNTLNVEMVTQGFRLRRISGYRIGQDDRFAVLYEQDGGPPSVERIAMPHSEFRAEVVAMAAFGARLVHISSYRFEGERYTAVWTRSPARRSRCAPTSTVASSTWRTPSWRRPGSAWSPSQATEQASSTHPVVPPSGVSYR